MSTSPLKKLRLQTFKASCRFVDAGNGTTSGYSKPNNTTYITQESAMSALLNTGFNIHCNNVVLISD